MLTKSIVIFALLASVQAGHINNCGCEAPPAREICKEECYQGEEECYHGAHGNRGYNNLNALRDLQHAQPNLPARHGSGVGYRCAEAAGSTASIRADNLIVPDKKTVTDQAKVSETVCQQNSGEQYCGVASHKWDVCGKIELKQADTTQTKSSSSHTS